MKSSIMIRVAMDGCVRRTYSFDKAHVAIGRDAGSDICLARPSISRLHCQLVRTESGYELHDRDSANGTTVNGKRTRNIALESGDTVGIEGYTLWVEIACTSDSLGPDRSGSSAPHSEPTIENPLDPRQAG